MELPNRKLPRLSNYDYGSAGAYFITICTHQKEHLFGRIYNNSMHLNDIGLIVNSEINKIESRYSNIKIDKYTIMPNHVHMIIFVDLTERINPFPTKACDIPNIIGKFKAGVTRAVGNAFMHSDDNKIWQSSYHDHIIRNRDDYINIWKYIDTNVLRWDIDCFHS